ncbi:MAG: hypothetical protein U0T32_04390 [Chitinophagales bacterium]
MRTVTLILLFLLLETTSFAQNNKFGIESSVSFLIEGGNNKTPGLGFGLNNIIEIKTRSSFSFIAGINTDFLFSGDVSLPNNVFYYGFAKMIQGVSQRIMFPLQARFTFGRGKPKFFFGFGIHPTLCLLYGDLMTYDYHPHGSSSPYYWEKKNVLTAPGVGIENSIGIRIPVNKKTELIVSSCVDFFTPEVYYGNTFGAIWKLNIGVNTHLKPEFKPKQ